MTSQSENSRWLTATLEAGDIYFSSPTTQFVAKAADLAIKDLSPVSKKTVADLFAQASSKNIENPILFGVVPFDVRQPASFVIPSSVERGAVPAASPADEANPNRPAIVSKTPVPQPEAYADAVREALAVFASGEADKIVLARAMDVQLGQSAHLPAILDDLIKRNRQGYNFALPVWSDTASYDYAGSMLGASPELLVKREGRQVFINPLAGSIGRHADPDIDESRRRGLAVSEKDLREHSYVVDDIVKNLQPFCDTLDVPDGPSVIGTDALWHLSTYITGTLKDAQTTALELSCALHPTPAICGYPTAVAFDYIQKLEPFERQYYAGLVGWQQANGDGEWALTLRCAFYGQDNVMRLYAGAGTVAGSDPDSEVTETATKMETFMRAIA